MYPGFIWGGFLKLLINFLKITEMKIQDLEQEIEKTPGELLLAMLTIVHSFGKMLPWTEQKNLLHKGK
ncbi:hypothetical protein [Endozoicomonas acroporae]|uniref:hypothetical protein n=1 Tax=Endozoicomonas acroporae TaxID=1701104 RepID=UPI003D7AC8AC